MALNPIFEDCAKLTSDPYWKDILLAAAQNRFPKGIKYDIKTNTLFIRTVLPSNKIITDPVPLGTTPQSTIQNFLDVFKDRLEIFSPMDKFTKKAEMDEQQNSKMADLSKPWKDLKPRSLKELILGRFIVHLKEKYGLTDQEAKRAYVTLQVGFQLKRLTTEDVVYENGVILEIHGFVYENNEFKITKGLACTNKKEKKNPSRKFDHTINAYISECKSKRFVV